MVSRLIGILWGNEFLNQIRSGDRTSYQNINKNNNFRIIGPGNMSGILWVFFFPSPGSVNLSTVDYFAVSKALSVIT